MPYKDPEKRREYHRQYSQAHKARLRAQQNEWKVRNIDKVRESGRKGTRRWKQNNPEAARESNRRTKAKQDPEHRRQKHREWLARNPNKRVEYSKKQQDKERMARAGPERPARLEYYRAYYAKNKKRIQAQMKASERLRRQADPEAFRREKRNSELKHDYGITIDDYDRMLREQGDCCKICGSKDPKSSRGLRIFSVDHCHKTGRVRGLLCVLCNTSLGGFKDDLAILERAVQYLREYEDVPLRSVSLI